MKIKNKLLKFFLLFLSLPLIAMSVSCGGKNNSDNSKSTSTVQPSVLFPSYINMPTDKLVNKLLKFEPQSDQEVKIEDKQLIEKYKNIYNVNNTLYDHEKEHVVDTKDENNKKVVIFLDGGPIFFWKNKDWKNKLKNLNLNPPYFNYEETEQALKDGLLTWNPLETERRHNKIQTNENRSFGKYMTYDLWQKYENQNNKKFQNDKVYSFIESQTQLIPKILEKSYSFNFFKEVQKMNFIMLHQLINKLHKENKEVYLWGSSFGGCILEGYLSRYGKNDADGMLIAGSPINISYYFDYLPEPNNLNKYLRYYYNTLYPTLQYLKKHLNEENILIKVPNIWDKIKRIEEIPLKYIDYFGGSSVATNILDRMLNHFIKLNLISNALINSQKISKNKLKNVIFLIGTKDDRFDKYDNFVAYGTWKWNKDFYRLKKWTWDNIAKSGADIRYLKNATHTAHWKYIFASPKIMWLMTNKIPIPDISTKEKYLQNVEEKYFNNN